MEDRDARFTIRGGIIRKETEKAYLITVWFQYFREDGKTGRDSTEIWVPKSLVKKNQNGLVQDFPSWLVSEKGKDIAKKNNYKAADLMLLDDGPEPEPTEEPSIPF